MQINCESGSAGSTSRDFRGNRLCVALLFAASFLALTAHGQAPTSATSKTLLVSEALRLWEASRADIKAKSRWVAKLIQPKMDDYRDSLQKHKDDPPGTDRVRHMDANIAAQNVVGRGIEAFLKGGAHYYEETDELARLQQALAREERNLRVTGFPSEGVIDARAHIDFAGFDVTPDEEDVILSLADEAAVSEDVLAEETLPFLPGAEPSTRTPVSITPHYTNELRARTIDENNDALKSYDVGVAIRKAGTTELVGSAAVIGKNLILTCAHVLGKEPKIDVNNYEIFSEQGVSENHIYPLGKRVAVGRFSRLADNWLDYALFEVEPGREDKKNISDRIKPWPISLARMSRDDAIYVSGYMQGSAGRIHPEGKILYPFQARHDGSNLAAFFLEGQTQGPNRDFYNRYYDDYVKCYKPDGFFLCLVRRIGTSENQPVHGAEVNGYPGHSGSPVFSWTRRQLIGILIGGKGTGPQRPHATWNDMEFVLPLAPVVKQLKQTRRFAEWQQRYGITIATESADSQLPSTSNSSQLANLKP